MALVAVTAAPVALAAPRSPSRGATAPRGLSLVQYAQGVGATGWNARVLSTADPTTTTVSGPRAAPDADGGTQVAYRNPSGDAIWQDGPSTGPFSTVDLSSDTGIAPLAGEPTPAVSPHGLDQVYCVTRSGHLLALTWDPYRRLPRGVPPVGRLDSWTRTDLTALAGPLVTGTPSVVVVNGLTTVFVRSTVGDLLEFADDGARGRPWNAYDLSLIAAGPRLASDPAAFYDPATQQVRIAATELSPTRGDVVVYTPNDFGGRVWTAADVTAATATAPVPGSVAAVVYGGGPTLLAATGAGHLLELVGADSGTTTQWAATDVTAATANSPAIVGSPSASVSGNRLAVAAVATWGDLVEWNATVPGGPFTVADLTVTGTGATRTVAGTPAAVFVAGALSVFAAGVKLPPPEGTGVYAIPSAKWAQAITDGWRVLGVTGGLGSRCAPWTAMPGPSPSEQPDEQVGAVIQASHVRETWLSFWTVSGPGTTPSSQCAAEPGPITSRTFYDHGYAAGKAVATIIDGYHALGLGLKPDWVIFDPEGYPDNHSGLWGPTSPASALARSVADYYAILSGWREGIASVDASLKAALYANQYEYMTYHLYGQPLPTFIAGAFSETTVKGKVVLVPPSRTAFGPNILGFVLFNDFSPTCAQVTDERLLLAEPPWQGAYNTLQIAPGKYCPPGANPAGRALAASR